MLECTHFDGGDRSDSLNPDGAESADGFEARARARTQIGHSSAMSRFPRPYSLHVGDIERVAQG